MPQARRCARVIHEINVLRNLNRPCRDVVWCPGGTLVGGCPSSPGSIRCGLADLQTRRKVAMLSRQMELGFQNHQGLRRAGRRQGRSRRADWWFEHIRAVVNDARDWPPAQPKTTPAQRPTVRADSVPTPKYHTVVLHFRTHFSCRRPVPCWVVRATVRSAHILHQAAFC
jgi:hypothetical protein